MKRIVIDHICDPCLKDDKVVKAIIGYKAQNQVFHACIKCKKSVIEFGLERWPVEDEVIRTDSDLGGEFFV